MPTKTKETNEKNVKIKKESTQKKSTSKKVTSTASKKTEKKKEALKNKKTVSKSVTTTRKKVSSAKKKTERTTKSPKIKEEKKKSTYIPKAKTTKTEKPLAEVVEYYDLPYRYNETVVKILYQTPNTLFVYWDISDSDRENYIKQYGEDFFNITRPVLIVHNYTMNYSFEIPINDFANSWYLHVNDSKCNYKAIIII